MVACEFTFTLAQSFWCFIEVHHYSMILIDLMVVRDPFTSKTHTEDQVLKANNKYVHFKMMVILYNKQNYFSSITVCSK